MIGKNIFHKKNINILQLKFRKYTLQARFKLIFRDFIMTSFKLKLSIKRLFRERKDRDFCNIRI